MFAQGWQSNDELLPNDCESVITVMIKQQCYATG